jgi:hypothetical protein
MSKYTPAILACMFLIVSCVSTQPEPPALIPAETSGQYIIIEPVQTYTIKVGEADGKPITKSWSDNTYFKLQRDVDKVLTNNDIDIVIEMVSGDGTIQVAPVKANVGRGHYHLYQTDFHYITTKVKDQNNKDAYVKIGYGVLIEADVQVLKAGVSLENLFAVSASANASAITGSLHARILGVSVQGAENILTFTSSNKPLSADTINDLTGQIQRLQAKFDNDTTTFSPVVYAQQGIGSQAKALKSIGEAQSPERDGYATGRFGVTLGWQLERYEFADGSPFPEGRAAAPGIKRQIKELLTQGKFPNTIDGLGAQQLIESVLTYYGTTDIQMHAFILIGIGSMRASLVGVSHNQENNEKMKQLAISAFRSIDATVVEDRDALAKAVLDAHPQSISEVMDTLKIFGENRP